MRLLPPFLLAALAATSLHALAEPPASLTEVYQLAVENNADLAAAREAYLARSENLPQARAGLLPQVGAGINNNSSRTKADTREAGSPGSKRYSHSYQASLSQPLFRLDRWYQLKAAQADTGQAALELSATEQALILQSAEAYFGVLRARDNLATSKAEENAYEQQHELAASRFEVGLSDKTDKLQAQAAWDNARANRMQAQQHVDDALQALTTLTNFPLERLQGLLHDLPIAAPEPEQAHAWVERALQDNLQLRAMDYALEAAEQDLRTRKSGHAPSVEAVAQYQKGDNDSLNMINRAGSPVTYNRNAEQSMIGIQISIPLYTGGATSSRVRQGIHQLQQVEHTRESLRRQVVQGTRNLFRAVNTDVEQVQARRQSIVSSMSAVEATRIGYEVGTRTIVDVLDAQRLLYAAARNYNNARYDYILDSLRLQQAAGTLAPDSLLALNTHLSVTQDAESGFLPPDLEQASAANLRR